MAVRNVLQLQILLKNEKAIRDARKLGDSFSYMTNILKRMLVFFAGYKILGLFQKALQSLYDTMLGGNILLENAIVQLEVFYGSTIKASNAIAYMKDAAIKTPFVLQDLIEATRTLKAFNLDIEKTMPHVLDWASAMGDTAKEIAVAMGKVAAGTARIGAILPTRGISLESFRALTRQGMTEIEALTQIIEQRFGGMAERLAQTFSGVWNNIKDQAFFIFTRISEDLFVSIKNKGLVPLFNYLEKKRLGLETESEAATRAARNVSSLLADEKLSALLTESQAQRLNLIKSTLKEYHITALVKETRADILRDIDASVFRTGQIVEELYAVEAGAQRAGNALGEVYRAAANAKTLRGLKNSDADRFFHALQALSSEQQSSLENATALMNAFGAQSELVYKTILPAGFDSMANGLDIINDKLAAIDLAIVATTIKYAEEAGRGENANRSLTASYSQMVDELYKYAALLDRLAQGYDRQTASALNFTDEQAKSLLRQIELGADFTIKLKTQTGFHQQIISAQLEELRNSDQIKEQRDSILKNVVMAVDAEERMAIITKELADLWKKTLESPETLTSTLMSIIEFELKLYKTKQKTIILENARLDVIEKYVNNLGKVSEMSAAEIGKLKTNLQSAESAATGLARAVMDSSGLFQNLIPVETEITAAGIRERLYEMRDALTAMTPKQKEQHQALQQIATILEKVAGYYADIKANTSDATDSLLDLYQTMATLSAGTRGAVGGEGLSVVRDELARQGQLLMQQVQAEDWMTKSVEKRAEIYGKLLAIMEALSVVNKENSFQAVMQDELQRIAVRNMEQILGSAVELMFTLHSTNAAIGDQIAALERQRAVAQGVAREETEIERINREIAALKAQQLTFGQAYLKWMLAELIPALIKELIITFMISALKQGFSGAGLMGGLETIRMMGNISGHQHGYDGTAYKPTTFMAGEAGREHISIEPRATMEYGLGTGGGGGTTIIVMGDINDSEGFYQRYREARYEDRRRRV